MPSRLSLLVSTVAIAACIASPRPVAAQLPAAAPSAKALPAAAFTLAAAEPLSLPSSTNLYAALPVSFSPAPDLSAIFAAPCAVPTVLNPDAAAAPAPAPPKPCVQPPGLYSSFLNNTLPAPLTPAQKAHLALHNLKDPGNLATIAYTSAFTVGTDSHTAYGPGFRGFGRIAGYSLLQDGTGEFFGTFLIPSLAHEDPHYHRMPNASIPRRILHAVSRTVIAQSDSGAPMPNFATLLTYPITAEISNLYVPGINGNGPSTVERVLTGYATDPAGNLVTEFLPDVARRIHVRIIFAQRILNQISSDQYTLP